MRVTGGDAARLRLEVPDVPGLRPTQDRVREALFSMLAARLPGARVLDLYAGTGSLAIEALSRGAASAVLVETHRGCLAAIQANLEHTRLAGSARVLPRDTLAFLRHETGPFDLVFADPPYQKARRGDTERGAPPRHAVFSPGALFAAVAPRLAPGGLFVFEFFAPNPPRDSAPLRLDREKRYGDTGIWFLTAPEKRESHDD